MLVNEIINIRNNCLKRPRRPLRVVLYISERCNLKCRFCEIGSSGTTAKDELGTQDIMDFIDEINIWGIKELYLTGGEPFMRPDIWELLDYCGNRGVNVSRLTTNGTLLRPLDPQQKKILAKTVRAVTVSLDTTDPEQHDGLRGQAGTFNKVVRGLRELKEQLKTQIHLSTVVTKYNFIQIPRLIEFAGKYNISHLGFQPVNILSNFPDRQPVAAKAVFLPKHEEVENVMRYIEEGILVGKKLRVSSNLFLLRFWLREYFNGNHNHQVAKNFWCFIPSVYAFVNARGDLLPCDLLPKTSNIREVGLKRAWLDSLTPVRERLRQGLQYPQCKSCYCEFPANLRFNLVCSPWRNIALVRKLFPYYLGRLANY